MTVQIINADVMEGLASLEDESVHCVVTSPPYFGLRDYGTAQWEGGDPDCDHVARRKPPTVGSSSTLGFPVDGGPRRIADGNTYHEAYTEQFKHLCGKCGATRIDKQIGLEPTPDAYVAKLVEVFREVRRVLRKDGTCWLNLGDSYSGNSLSGGDGSKAFGGTRPDKVKRQAAIISTAAPKRTGLKPKDLIGIPWRVAFALQADGWWLRQDIIWSKPNPMPESVTDRCTKAHEYIFLLTKDSRYFYDAEAIKEAELEGSAARYKYAKDGRINGAGSYADAANGVAVGGFVAPNAARTKNPHIPTDGKRNKRSVWEVTTQPFPEAHFATFPPALIEPCIKSGCPEKVCANCGAPWLREVDRTAMVIDRSERTHSKGRTRASGTMVEPAKSTTIGFSASCWCSIETAAGTVLDPFFGSGTTGLVADRLGRNAIGIELNPEYAAMAERRVKGDCPMFATVSHRNSA